MEESVAMLASHFEVEYSGYDGEDKRFKLEETMAGKEAVWAEIIREKVLVETPRRHHHLVVRGRPDQRQQGTTGEHEQVQGASIPRLPEHGEVFRYVD